jgi:hypothetical protein
MKLSKKQIIYGSVLAAAGVAYAIDAAFFGPPAAARAAQVSAEGAATTSSKPIADEIAPLAGPEHLLTSRLQKWATDHSSSLAEMSDVFQPPVVAKPTVVTSAHQTPPEDPILAFNRRHRLIAIVLDGSAGYALIDGQVLRIGQTVDGAKLIGLTRRQAQFSNAGRTFDVPLTADVVPDR